MLSDVLIREEIYSLNIDISQRWLERYIKFISSRKEIENGYGEYHHILPKSLFPQYRNRGSFPWNQIKISAREHYIVHLILWKTFPNNRSMTSAFWLMSNKEGRRISSSLYESIKKDKSESMTGESHPRYGHVNSEYARSVISMKNIELWDAERRRIWKERMKKYWSDEDNRRLRSEMMKGCDTSRLNSPTAIEKRSATRKQNNLVRETICCPHCDFKSSDQTNMKRWHFENCKHLKNDLICPHCSEVLDRNKRTERYFMKFHFDNCQHNKEHNPPCEHCGYWTPDRGRMNRWHHDRCKKKQKEVAKDKKDC